MLATVKGDVHDIGKNLVDIILSNNGYNVVNIGIKQPISEILQAAEEHEADVIGMSGLLVKSTVVMKENLEEMNSRGVAARWPVILGGAALTRAYVEQDLAEVYEGEVRYARDAFEGLRLMDAVAMARSTAGRVGERAARAAPAAGPGQGAPGRRRRARRTPARSDVATDNRCPTPPFWGDRVVKGVALADYASLPGRAGDVHRPVGPARAPAATGPSYEELVETEGRPRLRMWLDRIQTEGLLEAAVVYGYFPCYSEGDDLVVLHDDGPAKGQSGPGSPSRASAATGACAWPTSSAARSATSRTAGPTSSPSSWSRWAPGRARPPRSCSRRTPTATTSSCTACRCS